MPRFFARSGSVSLPTSLARQAKLALGTKYVAVEAGNPPTPARGDIEVADSSIDMWTDPVPIKPGIFIDEIRRRFIAELLVQTNFFKFVEKCIGFSQVVRIAKLTDKIGSSQKRRLFVNVLPVGRRRVWEPRESD